MVLRWYLGTIWWGLFFYTTISLGLGSRRHGPHALIGLCTPITRALKPACTVPSQLPFTGMNSGQGSIFLCWWGGRFFLSVMGYVILYWVENGCGIDGRWWAIGVVDGVYTKYCVWERNRIVLIDRVTVYIPVFDWCFNLWMVNLACSDSI